MFCRTFALADQALTAITYNCPVFRILFSNHFLVSLQSLENPILEFFYCVAYADCVMYVLD